MNNKLIIILIAILSILICISPIMANENTVLFDLNFLSGNSHDNITIKDFQIEKIKTEHTYSDGKIDKHNDYFLLFNIKFDTNPEGNYTIKVMGLDNNNKSFTVNSYVDKEGNVKIPLTTYNQVKSANLTITDKAGNILYENHTSQIKTTENITKDEPVKTEPAAPSSSSSSSSSSDATYWASSNSGKFHYPSCEWAQKISSKNKVVFHSRDKAISAGYSPCHVCGP